jgi:hypothetical protein
MKCARQASIPSTKEVGRCGQNFVPAADKRAFAGTLCSDQYQMACAPFNYALKFLSCLKLNELLAKFTYYLLLANMKLLAKYRYYDMWTLY